MEESVRTADADDLPTIAGLAAAAHAAGAGQRGGAIWQQREALAEPLAESIAALMGRSDAIVVAGAIDGVVVGYGAAESETLRDGRRLGRVLELYVEEEARGVGVAEAMMDAMVAWCRAQGCTGVDAVALPGDRDTKNFYERFGLVARAIVVHRSLEDAS